MLDVIDRKVEGQAVTAATPAPERKQVIDLMEALKQSLAKQPARDRKPLAKAGRQAAAPAAAAPKRAQGGRK